MTKPLLSDIVSLSALDQAIKDGYVRRNLHPYFPYAILNYTEAAQFDNHWDEVTTVCRGLIYDYNTNEVIARGMPKFFNYGQPGAPVIELDELVHVADKADGSLGIPYLSPGGGELYVATRGSFTSDQAVWASHWVKENGLAGAYQAIGLGWTPLYEIIYPGNRIVLNYGATEELRFLGLCAVRSGQWVPDTEDNSFGYMTFGQALAMPPRPNAEGLVIHSASGAMVKVKQEDYIRLHKAIFGLSARSLWEHIVEGTDLDEYVASLPDELHPWALETIRSLEAKVENEFVSLKYAYAEVVKELDREGEWGRKEFAMKVKDRDDSWAMFALLDEKNLRPVVWKRNKPEAFITPVIQHGEDVA